MPWWEVYTTKWFESAIVNYVFFRKLSKLQVVKMWNWEDDFISRTVPLFNNLRKHVSQRHKSLLCKECVGITFMRAIYLRMLCSSLLLSLSFARGRVKG
jgi:hypothetical protein